jgi:uncharacterized sporulation protein YeaH/YhbH (DUF444 family)
MQLKVESMLISYFKQLSQEYFISIILNSNFVSLKYQNVNYNYLAHTNSQINLFKARFFLKSVDL